MWFVPSFLSRSRHSSHVVVSAAAWLSLLPSASLNSSVVRSSRATDPTAYAPLKVTWKVCGHHGMSVTTMSNEMWIQCFSCCLTQQPPTVGPQQIYCLSHCLTISWLTLAYRGGAGRPSTALRSGCPPTSSTQPTWAPLTSRWVPRTWPGCRTTCSLRVDTTLPSLLMWAPLNTSFLCLVTSSQCTYLWKSNPAPFPPNMTPCWQKAPNTNPWLF